MSKQGKARGGTAPRRHAAIRLPGQPAPADRARLGSGRRPPRGLNITVSLRPANIYGPRRVTPRNAVAAGSSRDGAWPRATRPTPALPGFSVPGGYWALVEVKCRHNPARRWTLFGFPGSGPARALTPQAPDGQPQRQSLRWAQGRVQAFAVNARGKILLLARASPVLCVTAASPARRAQEGTGPGGGTQSRPIGRIERREASASRLLIGPQLGGV